MAGDKWYVAPRDVQGYEEDNLRFTSDGAAYAVAAALSGNSRYYQVDVAKYTGATRKHPPTYGNVETFTDVEREGVKRKAVLIAREKSCSDYNPPGGCPGELDPGGEDG